MIRLITIVTEDFWPGFAALLQSFTENGGFAPEEVSWSVYCDAESAPTKWLEGRREKIILNRMQDLPRIELLANQNQGRRMENALQKLGIFALPEELGPCVYLDSDMICLNAVRDFVDLRPIAAAYDHLQFSGDPSPLPPDQAVEFNTGVLVFEPSRRVFDELSATYRDKHGERTHKGDQDVFFFWAQRKEVHALGSEWNFSKRHQDLAGRAWVQARLPQIRFLHFVGAKPWMPNSEITTFRECQYRWIEEIWWDYFERSGFAAHMDNPPQRSIAFVRQWILPFTKPAILREHAMRLWRIARSNFPWKS